MRELIEIVEIGSGEDEDMLWVSLGFESELSPHDVLFIVCGKELFEQDRELGMDGLYFERFDQAYSCYHAARKIFVDETSVDVDFEPDGSRELELPESIRFDCRPALPGLREARKVFEKMAELEWAGAVICV